MLTQRYYAVKAATMVERFFPPENSLCAYRIVAALNLLNAIIKQPGGRSVTSYSYIKGMAACLFIWLLYHPIEHINLYWDEVEDVVYFRISGWQFSFHHVPLMNKYASMMRRVGLKEQLWNGERLQDIAVYLLEKCEPELLDADEEECRMLVCYMRKFELAHLYERLRNMKDVEIPRCVKYADVHSVSTQSVKQGQSQSVLNELLCHRRKDDKMFNLELALKFNGWWENYFELMRYGDPWRARVMCYTGKNYEELVRMLLGHRPLKYTRPEHLLNVGRRYFIRRHDWAWKRMTYSRYLLLIGHYNNLKVGDKHYNLCITYGLARYLAFVYPELRFVNVLNYTRMTVHRRIYTYRRLLHVPLHSNARVLKVWLVIDSQQLLRNLSIDELPSCLVHGYLEASDYKDFFKKVCCGKKEGLVAYSRFHLLPTVYAKIDVCGHYARVMNQENKWAVYSLMKEKFETDFIYDNIWYDSKTLMVLGKRDNLVVRLHGMYH